MLVIALVIALAEVTDAAATVASAARHQWKGGDFTPFVGGTTGALVQQFDAVCAND